MHLDFDACYRAMIAKDRRFDGVFFVGVKSTGIYCRCVCSARTPKSENCTFYRSPASAEAAGYRPCLLCRPERAPGQGRIPAPVDAVARLATLATRRIESGALDHGSLTELAARLGVSARHLRRAVLQTTGLSPVEIAQTQRLLSAKQLLSDTKMPVGEVALASGFRSLRRFQSSFQERYGLSPSDLRRNKQGRVETSLPVKVRVGYRPPYDWGGLLRFLSIRAIPGVETVDATTYRRTLIWNGEPGWISVTNLPEKCQLEVTLPENLVPILRSLLRRVRQAFDTDCRADLIAESLGQLAAGHEGLRVPGSLNGFQTAVQAILGQQVTVAVGVGQAARLARAFGRPIETPWSDLNLCFPASDDLAYADPSEISEHRILKQRATAIIGLAKAVQEGLTLDPEGDSRAVQSALLEIRGVGHWTAAYIALRVLGDPDSFLPGDAALRNALGSRDAKSCELIAEQWRPWRSYSVMHLWRSLDPTPDLRT